MQEELHTAEWLVSRIETTGLQAYFQLIPSEMTLPAVRFDVQDSRDVRGVGDERERILTRIDWLVAVVNEGPSIAALVPLADAVDTALQNQDGSTASILVLSCVRLQPFSLLEPEDSGVQYRHAGGIYRTMVQAP